MVTASVLDRTTANHVLALWPSQDDKPPAGGYIPPDQANRTLYVAASLLQGADLARLELVFPKHVAGVRLLRSDDGRDVLRAIAVAGV